MSEDDDDELVMVDEDGVLHDLTTQTSMEMAIDFPDLRSVALETSAFCDSVEEEATDEKQGWCRACSYQDDEWSIEEVLSRRMRHGVVHYLVKWVGAPRACWETAELLEDDGHGLSLAAFDGKGKPPAPSVKPSGSLFDARDYFPSYVADLTDAFRKCGHSLKEIHYMAPMAPLRSFTKALARNDHVTCRMLFHGTGAHNVPSIAMKGLLIPKAGDVANGSAYGVGIYAALNPSISVGYTRGCSYMFVCAALLHSQVTVCGQHGDICVFFHENNICPMWLVKFGPLDADAGPPTMYLGLEHTPFTKNVAPPTQDGGGPANRLIPRINPTTGIAVDVPKRYRVMTKRELRSAPREAKQFYKDGLVTQPRQTK